MTVCRIYTRYSTDRQSETSTEDQERVGRERAAREQWDVGGIYKDEGISGAAMGNRPRLLQLLAELRSGEVLIAADLFRLCRSQDLAPLITRLVFRGIRIVGVVDGFDSLSPTARMQAGLSGIMSEEYRANIAARTRSALELRAKTGRPTGGKAYENAEIVQEIFTRFAAGESMKSIASDLNRRQIPSPGADWKQRARPRGRWLVSTLHAILRNERYVGRLVWNRSQWVKDPDTGIRSRRERPQSEWVVNSCDRIIDDALWRRAQARFVIRKGRGGAPRFLLSSLLECSICGGKMIIVGSAQQRYGCGTNHQGGVHACANDSTFPRTTAERLILSPVIDDLLSPAAIAEGIKVMREERMAPAPTEAPDRERLELERMVKGGILSPEIAAPAIEAARRKAEERRRSVPVEVRPWPSEKAWRETVANMREILQGSDVIAAREILRELIGPARCRPAQDGHVVVELTTRHVLLATSTRRRTGTDDLEVYTQDGGSVDGCLARPRYHTYLLIRVPTWTGAAPRGSLDAAKVHAIRTQGLTDSHNARIYGVTVPTIRDARVGNTWPDHPTPPDRAPRSSWGSRGSASARPKKGAA